MGFKLRGGSGFNALDIGRDPTLPEQPCPICKKKLPGQHRYPKYVCGECEAKATDKSGRPVTFSNIGKVTVSRSKTGERITSIAIGGINGAYSDTGASYRHAICYIRGIRCKVEEAHFGGIVIQSTDKSPERHSPRRNSPGNLRGKK